MATAAPQFKIAGTSPVRPPPPDRDELARHYDLDEVNSALVSAGWNIDSYINTLVAMARDGKLRAADRMAAMDRLERHMLNVLRMSGQVRTITATATGSGGDLHLSTKEIHLLQSRVSRALPEEDDHAPGTIIDEAPDSQAVGDQYYTEGDRSPFDSDGTVQRFEGHHHRPLPDSHRPPA